MTKIAARIVIACDFEREDEFWNFLKFFGQRQLILKLGMQLLYQGNFQIIDKLKKQGHLIFVDLKLHDIPNTVAGAIKSLMMYDID